MAKGEKQTSFTVGSAIASDWLNRWLEIFEPIAVITVTSGFGTQTRLMGHFPLY